MSADAQQTQHRPTLQQLAGVLSSITEATQTLLGGNPALVAEVRHMYNSFLTSPTTLKVLGGKPTISPSTTASPSDSLRKEILEIKETISALSKTVTGQKATKSSPPSPSSNPKPSSSLKNIKVSTPPTYAALAASPERPSAVLGLADVTFTNRPSPATLCKTINFDLVDSPHAQVHISAAKWNARGNLILTAGHNTNAQQLRSALPFLVESFKKRTPAVQDKAITTRANVKWSRILLNRVPTGTSLTRQAYTTEECHEALAAENPAYAALQITHRPSWVKDPNSYKPGAVSSLSFAFEDPDGALAASLIKDKFLFAFGAMAATRKWKQRPTKVTPPSQNPSQTHGSSSTDRTTQPTPGLQVTPDISRPPPGQANKGPDQPQDRNKRITRSKKAPP